MRNNHPIWSMMKNQPTGSTMKIYDLPNELLVHIGKQCDWLTRKSLYKANRKLYLALGPIHRRVKEVSIIDQPKSAFKGEGPNFHIDIKVDQNFHVLLSYETTPSPQTVFLHIFDSRKGNRPPMKSRERVFHGDIVTHTRNIFQNLLSNYKVESIKCQTKLVDCLFSYTSTPLNSLEIKSYEENKEAIQYLKPRNLKLVHSPENPSNLNEITFYNFAEFPFVRTLHITESEINFDEMLHSKIEKCEVHSKKQVIKMENIEKLIEMFTYGKLSCQQLHLHTTIEVPEEQWGLRTIKSRTGAYACLDISCETIVFAVLED